MLLFIIGISFLRCFENRSADDIKSKIKIEMNIIVIILLAVSSALGIWKLIRKKKKMCICFRMCVHFLSPIELKSERGRYLTICRWMF